jgi:hypothetical protein
VWLVRLWFRHWRQRQHTLLLNQLLQEQLLLGLLQGLLRLLRGLCRLQLWLFKLLQELQVVMLLCSRQWRREPFSLLLHLRLILLLALLCLIHVLHLPLLLLLLRLHSWKLLGFQLNLHDSLRLLLSLPSQLCLLLFLLD